MLASPGPRMTAYEPLGRYTPETNFGHIAFASGRSFFTCIEIPWCAFDTKTVSTDRI